MALTPAKLIDLVEESLCAGLSWSRIEGELVERHGVTTKQVRTARTKVYARWTEQETTDAPFRKEKIIRMAEHAYAKAMKAEKHSVAMRALEILASMTGAFAQRDPDRDAWIAELGPLPTDPTMALVYVQRCMLFGLKEVLANPALDPEKRLRWISEIGGKIGMTHAKALLQAKLDEVSERVLGPSTDENPNGLSSEAVAWPAGSRFRPDDSIIDALPGHLPGPETPEDG